MDDDNLDDMLIKEPEAIEAPAAVEPAPDRDEQGRFTKAQTGDEPQETAETVPPTEQPMVPLAAKTDEVRKRQKLEDEVQALKQQLHAMQAPPEAPPSFYEDEDAAREYDRNIAITTAVQEAEQRSRMMFSEMMARRENPEFDALKEEFLTMAQQNPDLAVQGLQSADPWGEAMKIAKNARAVKELGTTDIASMKAKWREEFMAEQRSNAPPPSLTTERSVGQRTPPVWSGHTPLSDLLDQ